MKNNQLKTGLFWGVVACLSFPNSVFALSCAGLPLSQYIMIEDSNIIALKVVDTGQSTGSGNAYIDIEVTKKFISRENINSSIRIKLNPYDEPSLNQFSKNSEWLAVLGKSGDSYIIAPCAPVLPVENGFVMGKTGITVLDSSPDNVSLELFELAINAYQQGIVSAGTVCKSPNSYCSETKAVYDIETGILNLPTVQYSLFGTPVYVKAKMQKISDNPINFTVIEAN